MEPMRLMEHLQKEQEPFELEPYLLERGRTSKSLLYSQGSVGCFSSIRSSKNKKRKKNTSSPNKFSEIRNALCKKLVSVGEVVRLGRRHVADEKEAASMDESEKLSSASSTTEFGSCSEAPMEDTTTSMDGNQSQIQPSHQTNESATDHRMIQWTIIEENKQCSPDSVLDEIEASSNHNVGSNKQGGCPPTSSKSVFKKPTEDEILSASLWDLIIRRGKQSISGSNDTRSRYVNSKKALQQTRQLLFDCVREAVEGQRRQSKTGHLMGPETLGKIICDNIRVWNRGSATGKKITRMLRSDLLGFFKEWENWGGVGEDIAGEVGDQILEEIKDELVEEVIGFYTCKYT